MPKQSSAQKAAHVNRVPPHNDEAEQAVLACLMIEEQTFERIADIISPEDFYNRNNRIIFETILKLYSAGNAYDLTLVRAALNDAGLLEQTGGVAYLVSLCDIIPNAANIRLYATHAKNKAKLRKLITAATDIHELVYEYDRDITRNVDDILDEAGQKIFDLTKDASHKDIQPLTGLLLEANRRLEELAKRGEEVTGVPSGFFDLDKVTNGFQPGALVIVGGRTSMGKTAFALSIAQNAASAGKRVAIFSIEMTSNQLVQRLISMESEIPGWKLGTGKLSQTDWEYLPNVYQKLSEMPIYIDDTSSLSVMEIRSKCRRMAARRDQGLDLVIVDYLQLMEEKNIRFENRVQEVSSISRNLKGLARELDVPIIALSQLSRKPTDRPNKEPQLSDLRESGAIEQDADLVLFVHREDYYKDKKSDKTPQNTSDSGIAEIIVAKNRNGPMKKIFLGFQGDLTKFRNLDKQAFPQ